MTKLDGSATEQVHFVRLKRYCASEENTVVGSELLEFSSRTEERYELFKAIHDLGEDNEGLLFHTEWPVLPDRRDRTWVDFPDMYEDVPDIVSLLLRTVRGRKFPVTKDKNILSLCF